MKSPFRDEREQSIRTIERLERENAELRAELDAARNARGELPLVGFGFVVTVAAVVAGVIGGVLAAMRWMGPSF